MEIIHYTENNAKQVQDGKYLKKRMDVTDGGNIYIELIKGNIEYEYHMKYGSGETRTER